MASVNAVAPRTGGLLDTVLKGVSIARDIYGIKHDMAATDAAEQSAAQSKAKFDDEQAGVIGPKDYLAHADQFDQADAGTKGAIAINRRTGPGAEGIQKDYLLPKSAKSPLAQHVSVAGAMIDGKHGTAVYDPAAMDGTPTGGLRGFVETAKPAGPEKAPRTREIKTVENGKTVTKIVPDEIGGTYETPGNGRDEFQLQKDWKELGKTMISGNARTSTDMGRNQATVTNANKLLTLGAQGEKQEGGLDKRQIHEAAIASANLVSSGSGTAQATIEALVPHASGNMEASIEEWLTSNPKGIGQQAFVERMMETATREKHLAGENMKAIKSDILQEFGHLQAVDKDRWDKGVAYNFGKDAQFDEYGHYVPKEFNEKPKAAKQPGGTGMAVAGQGDAKPQAAFHPQATKAEDWARAHINSKVGDEASDAKKILDAIQTSDRADIPTPGGARP